MSKLTVRKNARRSSSSKAKENHGLGSAAVAQCRPRPRPRPTGKGAKVPQDSTVLANASNDDQEVRSAAETLVALCSGTPALPETSLDQYCCVVSNVAPSVPLSTASDIEDNEVDNEDEIDQLDSDDEEVISNDLFLPVGSPARLSRSNTATSVFDIPIEVPYKNAKRDVSGITSASSFAHVLREIAERMDAGPSRMAAIGYIPSFLPRSPKPIPKLLEDEECWEKLIRDVREYIESFTVKRSGPPKRIKPFVITIVDTIASLDNMATTASSAKKKKNVDETPTAALTGRESAQMEKVHLLEKRHHCQQHKKSCLVQDDGSHYHLTTNDLAKWALLMVDGDALAGVPPDELNLPKIAKRQEAAKRAAAKTAKAESPDHSQPPQWLQQMMGVMFMRDVARGPPLTPQPMHNPEFGILSNSSAALVNVNEPVIPVTAAKRLASPSFTADIPSLQDWFKTLKTIPGRKSSNALEFIPILEANDIEDLVDLVSFNAQELMDLTKMTIGLAKRLLRYAQEDLASTQNPKRQRLD